MGQDMDREMMKALEADGEKLRQLTGEDHGPFEIVQCEACAGTGHHVHRVTVYEHGCGFPHDDTYETPCEECGGDGMFYREAEGRPMPSPNHTK